MISPDDPRLVAYASGDLSAEETAALERELVDAPAARAEVERLRTLQADQTQAGKGKSIWRRQWTMPRWLEIAMAATCVVLVLAIILPTMGSQREADRKPVDASNLRQIGMASLVYANDHRDRLPLAADIWNYAEILARERILNDAMFWVSAQDPANHRSWKKLTTVLNQEGSDLEPVFRKIKPSWSVALGEIQLGKVPSTTPIAWTRGLQPDGKWAAHAPYGRSGGHVLFLGGNVQSFRDLSTDGGQLVRYDGEGKTGNILEALPPGVRIGEYLPTEQEQREWPEMIRRHQKQQQRERLFRAWAPVVLIASAVGLCVVLAMRRKWWALLAVFGFVVLLVAIVPACSVVR